MELTDKRLPSGVRVLCLSPFESELASLAVVFHVGFAHEDRDHLGISHMLEHLCFSDNATHTFPQFRGEIEQLGGTFNGFTGDTVTAFTMELLADHWRAGLHLLKDIAGYPQFTPDACEKETKVLLAETGQLKQRWLARFYERGWFRNYSILLKDKLWRDHMHPRKTFHRYEELTSEELSEWHKQRYRLDNMAVIAVGRIDPDELEQEIERCFRGLQKAGSPLPAHPQPVSPRTETEITTRLGEPFWNQSIVAVGAWNKGAQRGEKAICNVIHERLRHHAFDSLRLKHSLAYQVWSYSEGRKDAGHLLLGATVKRGNEEESEAFLRESLAEALGNDMSEAELEGIRNKLLARYARMNANPGWYLHELAMGAFDEYAMDMQSYPEQLRAVTPADVRDVLQRLVTECGPIVVRQIPLLSIPATVCLAALVLLCLLLLASLALMN